MQYTIQVGLLQNTTFFSFMIYRLVAPGAKSRSNTVSASSHGQTWIALHLKESGQNDEQAEVRHPINDCDEIFESDLQKTSQSQVID